MENASKALLMAGGILIALIIISMLLLMITNIGDYQRTKDSGAKATQIAKFNRDFERYTEDEIRGTDIVSLINKIADYNSRQTENTSSSSGTTNYVDYTIRMSITIRGLDEFNKKYAYDKENDSNQLFTTSEFIFGENVGNRIKNRLDEIAALDNNPNVDLKRWSSIYDPDNVNESKRNILNYIKESKRFSDEDWITQEIEYKRIINDNFDSIKLYRQFSEFKTSKFESYQDPVYENGQIQALFFKFVE